MRVFFIRNDGPGYAQYLEVPEKTTVAQFLNQVAPGWNAGDSWISVNRQAVSLPHELQDQDRLVLSQRKAAAAIPRPNGAAVPPRKEVLDFCQRLGIQDYLQTAVDLAHQCFPSLTGLELLPEREPETGEEYLTLKVEVPENADVDSFLDWNDSFFNNLVATIPWPQRDKFRLSYV